MTPSLDRRTLVRTAAWSVPALTVATAAPAFACSAGDTSEISINGTRTATSVGATELALFATGNAITGYYDGQYKVLTNNANTAWQMPALTRTRAGSPVTGTSTYTYVMTTVDTVVHNEGNTDLTGIKVDVFVPFGSELSFGTAGITTHLRSSGTPQPWTFVGATPLVGFTGGGTTVAGAGQLMTFTWPGTLEPGHSIDLEYYLTTTWTTGFLSLPTLPAVGITAGLPQPLALAEGTGECGLATDSELLSSLDLFS